jgi:hypothetical protein
MKVLGTAVKLIDRRQQPREHTFAHGLWTNVGIAIRKRIAFRFVPVDAESMAANSTEGSFRPNAAYAALIVSTADMMLPPDDCAALIAESVMLAGIGAARRQRPAAPESKCRDLPARRQYC